MKLYTLKSAYGGHPAGETIELDPEHFATKGLLENHTIEEAKTAVDDAVAKALAKLAEDNQAQINAAIVKGIELVGTKAGGSKGPRIDLVEAEADKTKSRQDWVKQVGIVGMTDVPMHIRQNAVERLEKVYQSPFTQWHSKAALAENSGTTGGYTAPPEYSSEWLRLAIEDTVFASRARQFTMTSQELHIPMLNQTSTPSAGQTAYTGGMVARWTGEAATRAETEPTWKAVTLKANELSGYTVASNNLLQDNIVALEQVLAQLIRDTAAWYIDYGCLQGDAVAKPQGIVGAAATINVTRATGNKIALPDVAKMMGKMLPKCRPNSIWLAGPDSYEQIVQLVNNNTSGLNVYLANVGTGYGQAQLDGAIPLMGRPLYFTEKLPALGTPGDLLLVDPSYYLVGNRMAIDIAASPHVKFLTNQMTWRFVARMDGQPWLDAPFTLQDGTRTLSPFVRLGS